MDENRPLFVTSEKAQNTPVLIVDKNGKIGAALAQILQEEFLVVLVTSLEMDFGKNIIHIPYHRKVPPIPGNTYPHVFIIYDGQKDVIDKLQAFVKKAKSTNANLF